MTRSTILVGFAFSGLAITAVPVRALAASPSYYADRPTFEAELDGIVREDYSNAAYVFIQPNDQMSAVTGETDYETAFDAFTRATRRLAKRQMTWWRSDPTVEWFHPDRDGDALMARAAAWLTSPCPSAISTSSSLSPR